MKRIISGFYRRFCFETTRYMITIQKRCIDATQQIARVKKIAEIISSCSFFSEDVALSLFLRPFSGNANGVPSLTLYETVVI